MIILDSVVSCSHKCRKAFTLIYFNADYKDVLKADANEDKEFKLAAIHPSDHWCFMSVVHLKTGSAVMP